MISPWIWKEKEDNVDVELPRDGWGCWHPIFPARLDDISMLLGAVIKPLETLLGTANISSLVVIEKKYDDAGSFTGIRIIKE